MTLEELKELKKKKLRRECENNIIPMLLSVIEDIKENNLENETWFLNFLDELNKISVSW